MVDWLVPGEVARAAAAVSWVAAMAGRVAAASRDKLMCVRLCVGGDDDDDDDGDGDKDIEDNEREKGDKRQ